MVNIDYDYSDWTDPAFVYPTVHPSEIAHTLPRHVGSRIIYTSEGDPTWRPASDVFETPDEVIIHVDLPGVPKDAITITLHKSYLVIHGTRPDVLSGHAYFESASSRVRERKIGKFRKIVQIPNEVDEEAVDVKYEDGLLEVKMKKKEEMKGKVIAIQ